MVLSSGLNWGVIRMNRKYMLMFVGVLSLLLSVQASCAQTVIDMDFKDAPLSDIFQILGELAGYNVLVDPSVTGQVSFYLKDLTVNEALELLTQATGYGYRIVNNTLVVASPERLAQRFPSNESAFVVLRNVSAADAIRLLGVIVPNVQTYMDQDLNIIVLFGSASEVSYAKEILHQYDSMGLDLEVAAPEAGSFVKRSIYIEYADGLAILGILQRTFPARQFTWDNELRLLFGSATEAEWEQIQIIVAAKDHPAFILKGIVRGAERVLALIEYAGQTILMQPGDSLLEWTIQKIVDKQVIFAKDGLSFSLEMGRQ
mgnify:CR=1 FL=1